MKLRLKQEKVHQLEEGFMKAIFFFQILYNLFKKNNNDRPEVVVLQQNLDSAQPKIGCLNFTKLESNFKAVGGDGTNTTARQCFCPSLLFKFVSH